MNCALQNLTNIHGMPLCSSPSSHLSSNSFLISAMSSLSSSFLIATLRPQDSNSFSSSKHGRTRFSQGSKPNLAHRSNIPLLVLVAMSRISRVVTSRVLSARSEVEQLSICLYMLHFSTIRCSTSLRNPSLTRERIHTCISLELISPQCKKLGTLNRFKEGLDTKKLVILENILVGWFTIIELLAINKPVIIGILKL